MAQFQDPALFVEFVPRDLLAGAISDLQRLLDMFPVRELDKLPAFSPEDYYMHEIDPTQPFYHYDAARGIATLDGNEHVVHLIAGRYYMCEKDPAHDTFNSWTWVQYRWALNSNACQIQRDRQGILEEFRQVAHLYEGYQNLLKEEYVLALGAFKAHQYHSFDVELFNSSDRITAALNNRKLEYYPAKDDNPWGGVYQRTTPPSPTVEFHDQGIYVLEMDTSQVIPTWSNTLINQIITFYQQGGSTRFYNYTLNMLRAAAYRGLCDYKSAAAIYSDLMAGHPGLFDNPGKDFFYPVLLSTQDNEQVRIQSGFNQLEWGDRSFARAYSLAEQEQAAELDHAKGRYQAALDGFAGYTMILDHDIQEVRRQVEQVEQAEQDAQRQLTNPNALPGGASTWGLQQPPPGAGIWGITPHPLAREIVAYAQMQLIKLAGNLNFLGYNQSFIPVQRYPFLAAHARDYATLAVESDMKAIHFKRLAEDEEFLAMTTAMQVESAGLPVQVGRSHYSDAEDRLKQDDINIKAITDKINSLQDRTAEAIIAFLGMAAAMAGTVLTAGAASPAIGAAAAGAAAGVAAAETTAGIAATEAAAAGVAAGTAAAEAAASAAFPTLGTIGSALQGFGSFMGGQIKADMNAQDQIAALYCQKQALILDKGIAARQRLIAAQEIEAAQRRAEYLSTCLQYLRDKAMNSDLYFALASTLKRVSRTYLQAGISMGYLAERAACFELGRPGLQFVQLDYDHSELKGLLAGDLLLQDLELLDYNRALWLRQQNHIKHIVSLREEFPLELLELLQTGQTVFALSLYKFEKAYPGTFQHRLKQVEVIIQGPIVKVTGQGRLTHRGSFLVRRKESTLQDESKRLLPTDEQLAQAYAELNANKLAAVEVGGVTAWQLPPSHRILSRYDLRQDAVVFPASAETLDIFEGYGPNGLWQLELPLDTNSLDLDKICDVQLVLYFDAQFDEALERKLRGFYNAREHAVVKGLIGQYELELTGGKPFDQIGMFSLHRCFPEAFKSWGKGRVDFDLVDADFPHSMVNKLVRMIVIQAQDEKGKGVEGLKLVVRGPAAEEAFPISFTTSKNGFTQDLQSDQRSRKEPALAQPLTGHWRITTPDQTLAKTVKDLVIFFMYSYDEREPQTGREELVEDLVGAATRP